MSDFILTDLHFRKGKLKKYINNIYTETSPEVKEYHGKWGTLCFSKNQYNEYSEYENDKHLFLVIGGPILLIEDIPPISKTAILYKKAINNELDLKKHLSGPFVLILIDKINKNFKISTDLMSFIPVYKYQLNDNIIVSTHVDILAKVAGIDKKIDIISELDFILNGIVTFPYTSYEDIRQLYPASIYNYINSEMFSKPYWIPKEKNHFRTINEAADYIRSSLKEYINIVSKNNKEIAHFISAGEDSRFISSLLKEHKKKRAIIFLDEMNREGRIAKKIANIYESKFTPLFREKNYYLNILPGVSKLIGKGAQYFHGHSYGLISDMESDVPIIGGFFADTILKGLPIKKKLFSNRFSFFPDIIDKEAGINTFENLDYFDEYYISEVNKRRKEHLEYIKSFRKDSFIEWFELWPSSMNKNIANIHTNRRLFKMYEPFTSNKVVIASSIIPQAWKINGKLYQKIIKPELKDTKFIIHDSGKLPYFPWYINIFTHFPIKVFMKVKDILEKKDNQGSWTNWKYLIGNDLWYKMLTEYSTGVKPINELFSEKELSAIINSDKLNTHQKLNLMQTLYNNT